MSIWRQKKTGWAFLETPGDTRLLPKVGRGGGRDRDGTDLGSGRQEQEGKDTTAPSCSLLFAFLPTDSHSHSVVSWLLPRSGTFLPDPLMHSRTHTASLHATLHTLHHPFLQHTPLTLLHILTHFLFLFCLLHAALHALHCHLLTHLLFLS